MQNLFLYEQYTDPIHHFRLIKLRSFEKYRMKQEQTKTNLNYNNKESGATK